MTVQDNLFVCALKEGGDEAFGIEAERLDNFANVEDFFGNVGDFWGVLNTHLVVRSRIGGADVCGAVWIVENDRLAEWWIASRVPEKNVVVKKKLMIWTVRLVVSQR